jgi:hypothetical protein
MPEKKRRALRRAVCSPPEPGGQSLQDEIDMLRDLLCRVRALAEEEHALDEMLRILEVASLSSSRLAGLLKTQRQLENGQSPSALMTEAMAAKIEELHNHG